LPLVEAYARLCGVDVHAELPQPDRFSIALSFRAVGSP
jgi:hypothetical protein